MTDVVVLGSNGMLGWMASYHLGQLHRVASFDRKKFEVNFNWPGMAWNLRYELLKYGSPDYIINCIGAIKPAFNDPKKHNLNVMTNSVFPWLLAEFAQEHNAKLIHITTDCVFDGKDGYYTESSTHNPLDAYGKSKSLGEPNNCMVLRTSIIGPEKNTNKSLIEWLLSNYGKKVNGFSNHWWNGLTTLELCKAIEMIIMEDLYQEGTFHIFSNDVTKYEMLKTMSDTWLLGVEVTPTEAAEPCNRILRTEKSLNSVLSPKPFDKMIEELTDYVV